MHRIMALEGRSSCSRTFCSTERCPFPCSRSYLHQHPSDLQLVAAASSVRICVHTCHSSVPCRRE